MMRAGTQAVMSLLALLIWFPAAHPILALAVMRGSGSGGGEAGGGIPVVTLQAQAGDSIEFRTQNGLDVHGTPAQVLELPYLVLARNGSLTSPDERTLLLTVSRLAIPPSGITVNLTIETQHSDPSPAGPDGDNADRIVVWQGSEQVDNRQSSAQKRAAVRFEVQFGAQEGSVHPSDDTPTGYMRYELAVLETGQPASAPLYTESREFAFLLENQWVAPLNEQAGPRELVVYYCDMVPFRRDDAGAPLARSEVTSYVANELVPALVEAIQVQTRDWGFSWSAAWTSYRGDRDAGRLSVALSDGETWFHGPAPVCGNAGISIRVTGGENADYDSLTDGLMSTFHHELFHNLQRSLLQELTGRENVSGQGNVWEFFSEGTAVLASSVGQPVIQFTQTSGARAYVSRAGRFVGGSGFAGDLNTSYAEMTPYRAAMYWRYLYEQCGGLEDAGTGMGVVFSALEVLYANDIVDMASSTDLVGQLPAIMDEALSSPAAAACPFRTYADSLVDFSRAIYGLRLDGGRCTAEGMPAGCGFYDPNGLYSAPLVAKLAYTGQAVAFDAARQPYPAGIRSSYGMDLLEVELDDSTGGQTLVLEFYGDPAGNARFSLQIWKLMDDGTGSGWQPHLVAVAPAEVLKQEDENDRLEVQIHPIDRTAFNRLALIVTRLDSGEDADPAGAYTIALHPGR